MNKTCFAMWMTPGRLYDLRSLGRWSDSDVELYGSEEEEEESDESSDEESAVEESRPNALQWSSTLRQINVEEFSIRHGPTRDLGENATAKDFFNVFINDAYIDEIVQYTVAYTRLKRDRLFTSTQGEISAYLGLNILIGIHELPQLAMYWDSDEFVGVDCLKKNDPRAPLHDSGEIFTSCWPDRRRPKRSPLQSLPPCNSLGAKVCLSEEHICIVQSETFHLGVKIGLFLLMTRKK